MRARQGCIGISPVPGVKLTSAGGALEDTQGSCIMKLQLQRNFEWTKLTTALAEELLHLYGGGVELSESLFSSDYTGTFTP